MSNALAYALLDPPSRAHHTRLGRSCCFSRCLGGGICRRLLFASWRALLDLLFLCLCCLDSFCCGATAASSPKFSPSLFHRNTSRHGAEPSSDGRFHTLQMSLCTTTHNVSRPHFDLSTPSKSCAPLTSDDRSTWIHSSAVLQ
jgi:hypothetical protein